jgi:hypothetical protein
MNGIVRTGTGRRRGKRRGPWAYTTPEARSQRRKGKLREVRHCSMWYHFVVTTAVRFVPFIVRNVASLHLLVILKCINVKSQANVVHTHHIHRLDTDICMAI